MDLSKAFDCLNHELLIAQLDAYGFSGSVMLFVHSCINDAKQRVKVNGSFSTWTKTALGLPQGSVLGTFSSIYTRMIWCIPLCSL